MIASGECHPRQLWKQLVLIADNPIASSHLLSTDVFVLRSKLRAHAKTGLWDPTIDEWRTRMLYLNTLARSPDWNAIRPLLPHHLYIVNNADHLTFEAASDFIEYLEVAGTPPDRILFDLIIRALSYQGDEEGVKTIIQRATDSGIERSSKMDNWTILSNLRAKNTTEALRQFRDLQNTTNPTVQTYTTVLSHAVRANDFPLMQTLYADMQSRNITPNINIYRSLLLGHMKQNNIPEAQHIFTLIQENGLEIRTDIYNAFMLGLIRLDRLNDAIDAYERMILSGVTPDLRTYGQLISACARKGMIITATRFYRLLISSGLEMGKVNYTIIMDMFSRGGDVEMVRKTMTDMQIVAGYTPDVGCFNILMDAEFRSGNGEGAWEEFERMRGTGVEPNWFTWEILMRGFLESGKVEEAVRVLREVQRLGLSVRNGLMIYFMECLREKEDATAAEQVLSIFQQITPATEQIPYPCYESLALAYLKSHNHTAAHECLLKLLKAGYVGRSLLYNELIASAVHKSNRDPDAAFQYYETMVRDSQRPNAFTISRLIVAYCQSRRNAEPLWNEIKTYDVEVDMYVAATFVFYYSFIRRDFDSAWRVWERYLGENDLFPGGKGLGVGTKEKMEERRRRLECVAGIMLKSCSAHRRMEEFKRVMGVVRREGGRVSEVVSLSIRNMDPELYDALMASEEGVEGKEG
ncbi:hypothetical protein HK097_008998 [Rhizophlyctis rosea]|uniref:Pentatricopeptide repeat-containing protein n=1 Tax=Rhizophlyctis rosea TaxID=64517 RepID=A0AAD5SCJ7_9FUNG|nr:hypothetical protein HK097_008998 [Rhizophlyctis rosea]